MFVPIRLNNGSAYEGKTRYLASSEPPKHNVIETHLGETLAAITTRAYGANTPELQEKILSANANLIGTVNVPR